MFDLIQTACGRQDKQVITNAQEPPPSSAIVSVYGAAVAKAAIVTCKQWQTRWGCCGKRYLRVVQYRHHRTQI